MDLRPVASRPQATSHRLRARSRLRLRLRHFLRPLAGGRGPPRARRSACRAGQGRSRSSARSCGLPVRQRRDAAVPCPSAPGGRRGSKSGERSDDRHFTSHDERIALLTARIAGAEGSRIQGARLRARETLVANAVEGRRERLSWPPAWTAVVVGLGLHDFGTGADCHPSAPRADHRTAAHLDRHLTAKRVPQAPLSHRARRTPAHRGSASLRTSSRQSEARYRPHGPFAFCVGSILAPVTLPLAIGPRG